MKKITLDNLAEFAPQYGDYLPRIDAFAALVGVDTPDEHRNYRAGLREWNRTSAIGFTDAELDVIELIHSVAKENQRYDNDPFIAPEHGGNTAEHPIFIGLALDHLKKQAGFGPENFDSSSEETLKLAKLSQRLHGMVAIHDAGELVDISYGEQHASGASRKEPDEEALVAPFQFKLAAYAISIDKPELFRDTIRALKANALKAKQELFQQAVDGKITGDEFVEQFGKVIGEGIAKAESAFTESDMLPDYRAAAENLQGLFEACEHGHGLEGAIFMTLDKFEGSAHYARYAGRAAKEYGLNTSEADAERKLLNRMFGKKTGESMSYTLMNSAGWVDQLQYTMKTVAKMFAALKDVPAEDREVAEKMVRAIAAGVVRVTIPLMQKGPAFVDFDADKQSEPAVDPVKQGEEASFAQRLDVQRDLKERALPKLKSRAGHIDIVEGVIDAKAVIAVVEKTAQAIESGAFTPDGSHKTIFPVGQELPDALKVSPQDLKAAAKQYPLDVASDFRGDQFQGAAVRL